jgi:hypothetical protein
MHTNLQIRTVLTMQYTAKVTAASKWKKLRIAVPRT